MFAITENTIKRLSSAPRSVGGSNEERDLWSCACGVFARSLSRKLKERFDFTPHEIECAVVLLCGPERYSDYLEIRHKRASLSPTYAAYKHSNSKKLYPHWNREHLTEWSTENGFSADSETRDGVVAVTRTEANRLALVRLGRSSYNDWITSKYPDCEDA